MTQILTFAVLATLMVMCNSVSTKIDFVEEEKPQGASSKEDEDLEVKHTIVFSTKLRNNNRGLHATGDSDALVLSRPNKNAKTDSGEVPIVKAYKSIDTTVIRSPDTRYKHRTTQRPIFQIADSNDFYPNTAFGSWKPSGFYNNVHYWGQDGFRSLSSSDINRRVNDGTREFYCRKCRELSDGPVSCGQKRSWFQSTTQRIKIDGKLAKLN
ncbi:unnamed protein product [Leptosia nina]|uniref:Secreted protein n=1 Tax=Leptosia nina TaxID=320188 RepID=A0AAV1J791_9NEOP